MTLAAILEVCLLMLSPAPGRPAMPAAVLIQASALPQDTTPANPQQPAKEPEKESPPAPAAPEQASPPADSPAQTTANPEAQPSQTPTAQTTPSQPPENPKPASSSQTPKTLDSKRKPGAAANRAKKPRQKRAAVRPVPAAPPKVVVKNGGTTDPAEKISPSVSQQQASTQRQNSGQLLASTGANLEKISGRQLTTSQQDMVKQIRQYMEQAKAAGDAGDLEREHNFALKADLLSAELVKH
jgi:hypothetical protein